MTDLEKAINNLDGHSICLCKNGKLITDDSKGISPMISFINEGRDLTGFSAADLIVGKAAAMLFVKAGIASVYGRVMSKAGKEYLERNNIYVSYEVLTYNIINRAGTDICPMEKTVQSIDSFEDGYNALNNKLIEIKEKRNV